jgi:ribosomal protein S18 acetylase RimI-like enzyme
MSGGIKFLSMDYKIEQIHPDNFHALMDLFIECFIEDPYYREIFPSPKTRAAKMKKEFEKNIAFCVNQGGAYGIYDGNGLIAFILYFNYQASRNNYPQGFNAIFGVAPGGSLPYYNYIHKPIEDSDDETIYLLSLGVRQSYRRKGLGGRLVDLILDHFKFYSIAGDVSNEASLEIYRLRGFKINPIKDGYFFIHREKQASAECSLEGEIKLLLPDTDIIKRALGDGSADRQNPREEIFIHGFETFTDCAVCSFRENLAAKETRAYVYSLTWDELLAVQRYINLAHYTETVYEVRSGTPLLLYNLILPHDNNLLINRELEEMIRTREKEWSLISDVLVFVPLEYKSAELLVSQELKGEMAGFFGCLDFRTQYESGTPKNSKEKDLSADFKSRIKRYYLGKVKIKITQELSSHSYQSIGKTIGEAAYADLILSVDQGSTSAVLSLVSLSTPFLISHLLDNIIRNQIFVLDQKNQWVNLYTYLSARYEIYKRGSPKICLTIPQPKSFLNNNQIASLLMGETIYASNEAFGSFTDSEILDTINSEYGIGQYDRAFLCASSNVLLQFFDSFRAKVKERLEEESIVFFYIELLMLEEASIQIVNNSIVSLIDGIEKISTVNFLHETHRISENYIKTITFWDIEMNYPSSKKSLNAFRKAFKIQEEIDRYERNHNELEFVFQTKRDLADRMENSMMNYILFFLTMVQGVSILIPVLFVDLEKFPFFQMIGFGIIITMFWVFWGIKRITIKRLFKKSTTAP